MKSMLHEASSITKAIEKAWSDAGNPTEFTIKVLDAGKKNFFGLTKRPAIVSITYEPRRQPARQQDANRQMDRKVVVSGAAKNSPITPSKQTTPTNQNQVRPLPKREPVNVPVARPVQPRPVAKETEKTVIDQGEFGAWQDEWVMYVSGQLKELLGLWGVKQEFSTKVDRRALTISLDSHLHDDPVEERNVFMGFSYLLMQFFKRNYKKKFRGFQIIITSKKNTP